MKKNLSMAIRVISCLAVFLFCCSVAHADTTGGISTRVDMQKKYGDDFYAEGMYKVGADIPAGEYMVFASSGTGYYCRSSDSNQNDIIENANFAYNDIIVINDGEYFQLSRCYAVLLDLVSNADIDVSGTGTFKAGLHIPAGEYRLVAESGTSAYYAIYNERNACKIVTNDLFQENTYVTVRDGQYIELSRCAFDPTPEKLEKTYSNTETVQAVQVALNEAGYDCGTPDGSAGPQTQAAIRSYQADNNLPVTGTVSESLVQHLLGNEEMADESTSPVETNTEPGISWTQLARTPDDYLGKEVTFLGEVVQVMEGDGYTQFRLAVEGNYDTILFCQISTDSLPMRMLGGDIIEVKGISLGLFTYETIMGGSVTIPAMLADSVEFYE